MLDSRTLRAIIGVIAAYAIALQAVLTAVVATGMAVAPPSDPAVICSSQLDGAAADHQPAGPAHTAHQACIVCAFAWAAAVPPSRATIAFVQIAATAVSWERTSVSIHLPRQRSPQVSQGPPQIA